jgi:WD40 repeat protein
VNQNERLINFDEGLLLATATDSSDFPYVYSDVGYDIGQIKKDINGYYPNSIPQLFAYNRTMIHDIHDRVSTNLRDGMYIRYDEGEEVYYGFSARTGQQLWASTPLNNAWALFTRNYIIAYEKMITSGFDGIVRCWDIKTGAILWSYDKGSAGFENAYGTYPEYAGLTVADGTVYTTADEHSSDGVLWRGASLWAIDIDTGQLKWKVNGMYRHPAIADGVLTALNSYDGQVYAFGPGPSKTTVSAPQVAVAKDSTVMITGTVTDQTPASMGTPAISDADMGAWMEYLHMQKVMPQDAVGVQVTLTAVDPHGDSFTIGTATTNIAGTYGVSFTPNIEGTYTITATFAGSASYSGSYDMTYMAVNLPAPSAQPTSTPQPTVAPTTAPPATPTPTASPSVVPEPEAAPSADIYIIAAAAAIIIVVVAVAAVFLRKRK